MWIEEHKAEYIGPCGHGKADSTWCCLTFSSSVYSGYTEGSKYWSILLVYKKWTLTVPLNDFTANTMWCIIGMQLRVTVLLMTGTRWCMLVVWRMIRVQCASNRCILLAASWPIIQGDSHSVFLCGCCSTQTCLMKLFSWRLYKQPWQFFSPNFIQQMRWDSRSLWTPHPVSCMHSFQCQIWVWFWASVSVTLRI